MSLYTTFLLLILCILILAIPRPYASLPLLICMLYIPQSPGIEIGSLNFTCYKILIIMGTVRVISRKELDVKDNNKIGMMILMWAITGFITFSILHKFNNQVFLRISTLFDSIFLYVFFKSVFKSVDDIVSICEILPIIIIPLALLMFYEGITGRNLFGLIGNVPFESAIREGRIRCQGAFAHPILAGTFGATIMPIILSLWWNKRYNRQLVIIGLCASSIITFFAASSGALMTFLLELFAFSLWPFRERMHWIRRALVLIIICLVIFMNAPIWFVFAKLSNATGGTGWHRSYLLNQAFGVYFHEWWLMGTLVTRHWMPYSGVYYSNEQTDITNQFLLEGVNGGIFTMLLFIGIIVNSFKAIGKILHKYNGKKFYQKILVWSFGVVLFGHVVSFMSISYFDQIKIYWIMIIGTISALSKIIPGNNIES